MYKATHGLAPSYIADMCIPDATVSTRQSLRSAARGDILVPRMRVTFGNRAFAVAGPEAWNSLPVDIRSSDTVTALPSRTVSKHICLNCSTASSSDVFDVDRRPCSDSRHVTALHYYYYYYYYYYYVNLLASNFILRNLLMYPFHNSVLLCLNGRLHKFCLFLGSTL